MRDQVSLALDRLPQLFAICNWVSLWVLEERHLLCRPTGESERSRQRLREKAPQMAIWKVLTRGNAQAKKTYADALLAF